MAYVGNQNYQAYVTLSNQTFVTSGATTIYSLNYTVTNANNIALYINNVPQQPSIAYTASGNTLTLTTATSSSMYAVYLGQGIQTTNLPTGVVSVSNLNASGTPGSTNFLRGDNSWNGVGINQLTATGSPSSATFLRGDNTWASSALTGNVLQVVSTTKTDTFSSQTNSFIDVTGLSVSITPSSASNKILIFTDMRFGTNGNASYVYFQLVRGSTGIYLGDAAGSRIQGFGGGPTVDAATMLQLSTVFLDSPSTNSSTTYKIQAYNQNTAYIVYVNRSYTDANNASYLRAASSITVMEIKG